MALVLDASVVLKWLLNEDGADRARALIGSDSLIAPDFLLLECANVLGVKERRGLLPAEVAPDALRGLRDGPIRLQPSAPLALDALALSLSLGHSAYDCLYLALALAEQATVVTADQRFARAAEARYPGMVRLLGA